MAPKVNRTRTGMVAGALLMKRKLLDALDATADASTKEDEGKETSTISAPDSVKESTADADKRGGI
jgi:hypothetical protein